MSVISTYSLRSPPDEVFPRHVRLTGSRRFPLAAIPLAVPFDVVYPQSAQSDAVAAMQGDRNAGLHDAYNALLPRERITGLTEKRST